MVHDNIRLPRLLVSSRCDHCAEISNRQMQSKQKPCQLALDNMRLTNGGMAILKAADLKEATNHGTDDPTVQSGMLKVEMKTFWVPFHG